MRVQSKKLRFPLEKMLYILMAQMSKWKRKRKGAYIFSLLIFPIKAGVVFLKKIVLMYNHLSLAQNLVSPLRYSCWKLTPMLCFNYYFMIADCCHTEFFYCILIQPYCLLGFINLLIISMSKIWSVLHSYLVDILGRYNYKFNFLNS